MSIDLDDLYPYKHSLVDEFFIKTADDNYVVARWCADNGMDVDFFWLALHCLEKYLKAALVLNGRSAKNYGHNIKALYADVHPLAPELLPITLTIPD
jgi:HEPN domain-containing protein